MAPEDTASTSTTSSRGRRRLHHACLSCRRKKTRCPGEKPACSSCVRLKQPCSYPPARRSSQSGRSEERLAHLEEKLELILSGSLTNYPSRQRDDQQMLEDVTDTSEKSYSATSPPEPSTYPLATSNSNNNNNNTTTSSITTNNNKHNSSTSANDNSNNNNNNCLDGESNAAAAAAWPNPADVAVGIDLYFKYCHRQPIWCFDRADVADLSRLPDEFAYSLLALTGRFTEKRPTTTTFGRHAKSLVMLRIANGNVDIMTIESLCLLSYSFFMDGNVHLGQFHLGLAFQLIRSAMLDLTTAYGVQDAMRERKKRLFWSLQLLEQSYGRQTGLLSVPTEIWRPAYRESLADVPAPPLPTDELGTADRSEPGIWNTSVHLGWVWSQVRKYVSNCAAGILSEPWRYDSMYAKVLADFMETENRIPMCHRYDSVKFYEVKVDDVRAHRDYYSPWLKEQFTYHAIHTVLNHPFLYIVGAQHNPNLAIPNTFWRRSSELALLHSTWIVRMIDMVVDKQVPLVDPFFGHIAAIAATVHLYYCCAAAAKLKHKSNTDFAKCRRFLKSFIPVSAACQALDRNLDRMTRIAAGSETMDVEDWMPSRIYLSVPLMWEILQFNSVPDSQELPNAGLLDASLAPPMAREEPSEATTLEIIVATSPEITINTADGGQEAPTLSYKAPPSAAAAKTHSVCDEGEGFDNLTFNTTPWLYADSSQLVNIADMGFSDPGSVEDDRGGGMAWWEDEGFGNVMFNSF